MTTANDYDTAFAVPDPSDTEVLELEHMNALVQILEAVKAGGTLVLTGPGSVVSPSFKGYGTTLESETGARHASAEGSKLGPTLLELAAKWKAAT